MSRIGKKPIAIPKGVTVKIEGNTVLVQGPKGKMDTPLPTGIKVEQKDGHLVAVRENDSQSAVHGLARALVNNAVEGVTKGWTRLFPQASRWSRRMGTLSPSARMIRRLLCTDWRGLW